jgi:hypothetical protein
MAVAEMGLAVNLLPMARNYSSLLSIEVQQSGVDKLHDNRPRDQQQARQAQMPHANGENVVRESRADDEVGALDADTNDSIRELEELLTKLNPLAKEFIPPSHPRVASSIPKQNYRKVAPMPVSFVVFLVVLSRLLCYVCSLIFTQPESVDVDLVDVIEECYKCG